MEIKATTTAVIKCESKDSPMSEGNTCVTESNFNIDEDFTLTTDED